MLNYCRSVIELQNGFTFLDLIVIQIEANYDESIFLKYAFYIPQVIFC